MLYKKSGTKTLERGLFESPTAEYRATPFWAWNCILNKDTLLRQIDCFAEMGFGGFHMHTRAGMGTKYLSDEFMELIKTCRDKAEEKGMLAWLYDEDRWPSGAAGGYVTKNKAFRQRRLIFTEKPMDHLPREQAVAEGKGYFLGAYDVTLNKDGLLEAYSPVGENDEAKGIKRYAYCVASFESGWFNGQTYVDTLSKEAMAEFIRITYEAYDRAVGESFGKSVPAIFTDEPQTAPKGRLAYAHGHEDVLLPFTPDLPETFTAAYGEDLIAHLPELFWDRADGKPSRIRYLYHDHVCERFTESFSDQCGAWCEKHGIALTGHMMAEAGLGSQTWAIGEAMRAYRSFAIPGIDMLCDAIELTTAKQAESAKNQYGREGMMSELYGVTNWDFDFRGHKFQGDWQAALGVTVRVPHLAWVSMKGSAKRDYPASMGCQAPWYKDYSFVEDHFARLNTVLTRGKPVVKVGVIHPIESYWLSFGPGDTGSVLRNKLEGQFGGITEALLGGMVDFDFISESLLPSLCGKVDTTLAVGEMAYSTVLVPGLVTVRSTTLAILKEFAAKGGRVIFVGDIPTCVDAVESDEARAFAAACERVPFDYTALLGMLKAERAAELLLPDGSRSSGYLHALRQDGEARWFFLAHKAHQNERKMAGVSRYDNLRTIENSTPDRLRIVFPEEYIPTVYDTVNGKTFTPVYQAKDGKTVVEYTLYTHDSLLLRLEKGKGEEKKKSAPACLARFDFRHSVPYAREEDNVCVLDMAEYSVEGTSFIGPEEVLRIDKACRGKYGFPLANGTDCQPWAIEGAEETKMVRLRFRLHSYARIADCHLAAEELLALTVNGKEIALKDEGYYVDESIRKYPIGEMAEGENLLEMTVPFGKRVSLENMFLLGDFDVQVKGCECFLLPPSRQIGFGNTTAQGLSFYGGNLVYQTRLTTPAGTMRVQVPRYRGAAVRVSLDGKPVGYVAYAPYTLTVEGVTAGEHELTFTLLGSRVNTFGALHNSSANVWFGPTIWYTGDLRKPDGTDAAAWSYEHVLAETGILSSPIVEIFEEEKN
ncbi:MAG: hypothetical protein J6R89_00490 [Clostridia bacterium]|nr:hypothetical protein [Clostridia bacterium]